METNETKRPAVEMLMKYLTRAKDDEKFYKQRCKKTEWRFIVTKADKAVHYAAYLFLLFSVLNLFPF